MRSPKRSSPFAMGFAQPRHLARPLAAGSKTCGMTPILFEQGKLREGAGGGRRLARGRLRAVEILGLQLLRQLEVAAAGIRKLHLPRRLALGLEQKGIPDDDAGALRA